MVQASGIRVPRGQAEATRRRLLELDVLRIDLAVAKDGDDIVFPVLETCGPQLPLVQHDFEARAVRPAGYQDLLPWPAEKRALAPRAFDQVGDILIVKVPKDFDNPADTKDLGRSLLDFHPAARAAFHDKGVKDEFRVRDLVRIAGAGESLTMVNENKARLWVDPAQAYFSPRLASERARVAALVRAGEHILDLFGGVAPFGIQAALAGASVDSIDLNPAACDLARRNVTLNGVEGRVRVHLGDARKVAATLGPADRIVMNLPHGAKAFLDVAAKAAKPGATVHYHEIMPPERADDRTREVVAELARHGWRCKPKGHRVVRNYSPQEAHVVFDLEGAP
ncbi:MAG: class I SAM-dependent methyltransferase family protein [Candidatus Thermoplasmatota archaeon]